VFDFDAVIHESNRTPFAFKSGGKAFRVPHISDLTIGQQIDADAGRLHQVLREVAEVYEADKPTEENPEPQPEWKPAGRAGAELILKRRPDQVGKFQAAWIAHAGLAVGESPASSS
jgi:hypothetical protein